jgi:YHS domain-containing protein
MKKETKCNECNGIAETNYYCDTCEDNLISKFLGVPITIDFSYGSSLDGEEYHFCDYKCLLKFIVGELRKQQLEEKKK